MSTSEVVVPFLNSFIASTVAVNQTPLSFYCPRSRLEPARSIVTTRGRTRSLSSARESPIEISLVSPPFVHLCSPSLPPPLPIVSKIRDRILPIGSLNRSSRRGGKRFVGRISLIVGRYHVVTTLDDRVPYSPRAETLKRFSIRVTRVPNVDPLHLSLSPVESRVGQALPLLQRRGEHNRGAGM